MDSLEGARPMLEEGPLDDWMFVSIQKLDDWMKSLNDIRKY
jgi:hypothetical protein